MKGLYAPPQGELFGPRDLVGSALAALVEALDGAAGAASAVTLLQAQALAAQHLTTIDAITPISLDRFTAIWSRFDRFAWRAFGVTLIAEVDAVVVHSFLNARTSKAMTPSPATSHLRRSAIRLLFRVLRELRLATADPTLDLALPSRTKRLVRPLTDDEVDLCRWASLSTLAATRRPSVWALAEAGATTTEIGNVTIGDLDLDAGRVWLAGSPKTEARSAMLTDWGRRQLARRAHALAEHDASSSLTYEGAGDDHSRRTSSAEAVSLVLRHAGLLGEPDVSIRSVTAWAGSRVLVETGRIDEAARYLGLRSLDLASELVGFDWRQAP